MGQTFNCPHCGKTIPKDFAHFHVPQIRVLTGTKNTLVLGICVSPGCGSQRNCKDGMRQGKIQRYLCRDCGYRFS